MLVFLLLLLVLFPLLRAGRPPPAVAELLRLVFMLLHAGASPPLAAAANLTGVCWSSSFYSSCCCYCCSCQLPAVALLVASHCHTEWSALLMAAAKEMLL
jgi:hypothetical protein